MLVSGSVIFRGFGSNMGMAKASIIQSSEHESTER